jgi:hypothetical protein
VSLEEAVVLTAAETAAAVAREDFKKEQVQD